MEIKAQVDSVQFYQECQKGILGAGIYEVVEHDGTLSYCELNGFGNEKWMDQTEFEVLKEKAKNEQFWQSNMDAMDRWDDEQDDVDPDHYNDCGGCAACHLCMS